MTKFYYFGSRVSHTAGGGGAWGATPPSNDLGGNGGCPPFENEAPPPSEKNPLKLEAPFHEMIPRKSAINNNLKSS